MSQWDEKQQIFELLSKMRSMSIRNPTNDSVKMPIISKSTSEDCLRNIKVPSPQSSQQSKREFTDCPSCNELLTNPRTLPCLHSYCYECLVDMRKPHRPRCLICEADIDLAESLSPLKSNPFVERMREARELTADDSSESGTSDSKNCDTCAAGEGSTPNSLVKTATMYCVECQETMCDDCSGCHGRMKISRSHWRVKIDDMTKIEELRKSILPMKCDKHRGKEMEVYCLKCDLMMCVLCFLTEHKDHECSSSSEQVNAFRSKLTSDTASSTSRVEDYRQLSHKVTAAKIDFTKDMESVKVRVRSHAIEMKNSIDRDVNRIIDEVTSLTKDRLDEIDKAVREAGQKMKMVGGWREYAEELAKSGTVVEVLRDFGMLQAKKEELLDLELVQRQLDKIKSAEVTFKPSKPWTAVTKDNIVGHLVRGSESAIDVPEVESGISTQLAGITFSSGVRGTSSGPTLYTRTTRTSSTPSTTFSGTSICTNSLISSVSSSHSFFHPPFQFSAQSGLSARFVTDPMFRWGTSTKSTAPTADVLRWDSPKSTSSK